MLVHLLILVGSFLIILVGSELFTNGVEWAGERLSISEAAVGSLLAAVGTALPETFVPAVALLTGGKQNQAYHAVGVGAIVGAPLMLSTIALLVMGLAAIGFRQRRERVALAVPPDDARRDLSFFIPIFVVLIAIGVPATSATLRHVLAALLLVVYVIYAVMMLRLKRAVDSEIEHNLYLSKLTGSRAARPRLWLILLQVLLGVIAILVGAQGFVDQIVLFSKHAGLNPGVLSLILSPLATELPEKYNSVIWIRQSKDHLALANITGAMVFQSCIPVAIGLAMTSWHLTSAELLASSLAVLSAMLLYVNIGDGEIGAPTLMTGGAGYAVFLIGLYFLGLL